MELQSSANKRDMPALVAVRGYGSTFGADTEASCPATETISRSMSDALKHADLAPSDIDLIIAKRSVIFFSSYCFSSLLFRHLLFTGHAREVRCELEIPFTN